MMKESIGMFFSFLKNTCEGIDELLYIDLEDATTENATQGLIDIREAMRNPSKTYI